MKAGPELDALVAQKVMGLKVVKTVWGKQNQYCSYSIGEPDYSYTSEEPAGYLSNPLPSYSEDIAAAWEVISCLQRQGWSFILDDMCSGKTYQCHFERERHEVYNVTDVETAPLAICLAALRAVGEPPQK